MFFKKCQKLTNHADQFPVRQLIKKLMTVKIVDAIVIIFKNVKKIVSAPCVCFVDIAIEAIESGSVSTAIAIAKNTISITPTPAH